MEEYTTFRVAQVAGVSLLEAQRMDPAEANRVLRFSHVQDIARRVQEKLSEI